MNCLSEDQMLNHTSDSLEHQQISVSGIPTEKCSWLKMNLPPPNSKSRDQIAEVTTVKSFTAPKNIPGVCNISRYFKYLAMVTTWQVESLECDIL